MQVGLENAKCHKYINTRNLKINETRLTVRDVCCQGWF